MSVIQLVRYPGRDTIAVLRVLLAKALRGELRGVVLCYRTDDGAEEAVFTGVYKARPEYAMSAAMHLSMDMNRDRDRVNGPPSL